MKEKGSKDSIIDQEGYYEILDELRLHVQKAVNKKEGKKENGDVGFEPIKTSF